MTKMLASVNSLAEARIVLALAVDIIDLKQPEQGALGALSAKAVKTIVQDVAGRIPVSATIGDLPMQADIIYQATLQMAKTGVDFVKIGFFPDGDSSAVIRKLANISPQQKLIAVLFADALPDLAILNALKTAGFAGVMLDTMYKDQGSLVKVLPDSVLQHFVTACKKQNLLSGLAGSLRLSDIALLLTYQPDYLGFRGALCIKQQRTAKLDALAVQQVKQAIATACH